jgi:hypothetical protein
MRVSFAKHLIALCAACVVGACAAKQDPRGCRHGGRCSARPRRRRWTVRLDSPNERGGTHDSSDVPVGRHIGYYRNPAPPGRLVSLPRDHHRILRLYALWIEGPRAALFNCPRRRGDRIANPNVRFWHGADIKLRPLFGRYQVQSGHHRLVMSFSAFVDGSMNTSEENASASRDGRAPLRHDQGPDGSDPLPDEDAATGGRRDGAARPGLQYDKGDEHHRYPVLMAAIRA